MGNTAKLRYDEPGTASVYDPVDGCRAAMLRAQAQRCRRLALATTDRQASDALEAMAERYASRAATLEGISPD